MDRSINVTVVINEEPGSGSITMTKTNGEVEEFPLDVFAGIGFMEWLVPIASTHRAARRAATV